MSMQWFRMYSEFATDPKVQMLSETIQRRYVMLLCIRCGNDYVTFHDDEIAFQLRVSLDDWMETKAILVSKGLITEDNQPCAWDKRQYVSDSSTARVRAHRERKKKQGKQQRNACNVSVTPPDTDTDTDTEYNSLSTREPDSQTPVEPPSAPPPASDNMHQMHDDWQPDEQLLSMLLRIQSSVTREAITPELIDKYRLYCLSKGNYQSSRGWHTGLIRWAINEKTTAAKVVPMRHPSAGMPDFNDTSWADDLGVM